MATAIVNGIIAHSVLNPRDIVISDTDKEKLQRFAGIATTDDNKYVAANCTNLLFAVKPQSAPAVFDDIKEEIDAPTVISIMAGVPIAALKNALGNRNYARIMPNTPALVGEGMSAIAFDGARSQFVIDIFSALGKTIELDESQFDAVTALSGSGPAYVYLFIKSLTDGGIQCGLSPDVAKLLALQTVKGAQKMVETSNKSIDELIDAVCSKGGTTIQAIESFKQDGLVEIVAKGMAKCKHRSEELSKL